MQKISSGILIIKSIRKQKSRQLNKQRQREQIPCINSVSVETQFSGVKFQFLVIFRDSLCHLHSLGSRG